MAFPLPTIDPLAALMVETPCKVPWDEMRGDERERFCGRCERSVFDLTNLTTREVLDLLGVGQPLPCVRIYRRPDGRVMTADCPLGVRARTWRWLHRRTAWTAAAFASLLLPACRTMTQGMPTRPDFETLEKMKPTTPSAEPEKPREPTASGRG